MKKLIFIFLTILIHVNMSCHAQVMFTDSVRYELKKFLIERGDAAYPNSIDTANFEIQSMLTKDVISMPNHMGREVDVYEFKQIVGTGYSHALLVYYDKFHRIDMRKDYPDIINDLFTYFKANPDIDKRLLPKFTTLLSNLYLRNTLGHQKGEWFNFWEQRDSLSKQLNIKSSDWIK